MKYICVQWLTNSDDLPVLHYSELDASRYEVRKVWKFNNGNLRFADGSNFDDDIWLADQRIPELEEIAKDQEFIPEEITKAEFERVWEAAILGAG